MFDKLIVCEPEGAGQKNRRGYFVVSSVVVGVLFITAVVISIFAADFDLGSRDLDLARLVAPHEMMPPEAEPPEPTRPNQSPADSQSPMRTEIIDRIEDSRVIPPEISTIPSNHMQRPLIPFDVGSRDFDPKRSDGSGRDPSGSPSSAPGLGTPQSSTENRTENEPEPPPVKKSEVKRPTVLRSEGPINGKALSLPIPPYPAPARTMGITGKVDVQVMIDEHGKVISANAVSGHPLLRGSAEKAAWNARFSPTYLAKVPVKVTGVIVYNFTK